MTPIDFQVMNRIQLRAYILDNPQDQQAFHFYMDRLVQEPALVKGNMEDLNDYQAVTDIIEKVAAIKQEHKKL